jgi:hypothetical protein
MNDSIQSSLLLGILDQAAAGLDQCVQALSTSFELPERVTINDDWYVFRHAEKSDLLLQFMKLVKIASHNNAALVLIRKGYVYEIYALCRMIDEACEDIHFLEAPLGEDDKPSKYQLRFFEDFFQEEFSGQDLVESQNPRDRVPRHRIRAALTKHWADGVKRDTSREIKIGKVLYGTFSGFVHGAYVHLMELFGGSPLRFHTHGMMETPRIWECLRNQLNYVFRSLLAVEAVAQRTYRQDVFNRALDLNIALARQAGFLEDDEIERMVKRRAQPLAKPT